MAETLENQILHALGQVFDHDKDKNIVSLGIVKNINVEAGNVNVILEFDRNDSNLQKIYEESEKVLSEIPGVTKFNIITTYHSNGTESQPTEENKVVSDEQAISGLGTEKIKYILMVASGKGGVGKSTVGSNLAIVFILIGLKTFLIVAEFFVQSIPTFFYIN
jgi:ATP-binding protein involved in chromosome partitioning